MHAMARFDSLVHLLKVLFLAWLCPSSARDLLISDHENVWRTGGRVHLNRSIKYKKIILKSHIVKVEYAWSV